MTGKKCGNCGKVYNKYLGDRFWGGGYEVDGEKFELLCDNCHRNLIRN